MGMSSGEGRGLRRSRVSSRVIADFASWQEMAATFGNRSSRIDPRQSSALPQMDASGVTHPSHDQNSADKPSRLSVTGSIVMGSSGVSGNTPSTSQRASRIGRDENPPVRPSSETPHISEPQINVLESGTEGGADGQTQGQTLRHVEAEAEATGLPPASSLLTIPSTQSVRRFSTATAASEYGTSVYDMYFGPDAALDEPSPSVPRIPSLYRPGPSGQAAVEITERADGSVVWQVLANLGDARDATDDGESIFSNNSAMGPPSPHSPHSPQRLPSSPRKTKDSHLSTLGFNEISARRASREIARQAWEEAERTRSFLTGWRASSHQNTNYKQEAPLAQPRSSAEASEEYDHNEVEPNQAQTQSSVPVAPNGLTRILYSDDMDLVAMLEQFAQGRDNAHFDIQPAHPRPPSLRLPSADASPDITDQMRADAHKNVNDNAHSDTHENPEHQVRNSNMSEEGVSVTLDLGDVTGTTSGVSGLLTVHGDDDAISTSPGESDAFRFAYASSPQPGTGQQKVSPTPSVVHERTRRRVEEESKLITASVGGGELVILTL